MVYTEAIVFFFIFLAAYTLYVQYIEKRKALEISSKLCLNELGKGFLISLALVGTVVAFLAVIGSYLIAEWNPDKKVAIDLLIKFMLGAMIEEIIFRLIIFKLTEELLGTWLALIIQAVLFGFAHMANDNATLFTSFSVIIVGGIIYTAAFIYTRRIWLALGLHAGWNYFQSGIFGMPNSGTAYRGLIIPEIQGKEWITGGNWGIEASYIAILLVLIAGVYFILKAIKANQIVQPLWIRKRIP
jgi:membrane protease YdiL (CAAX protease family)